MSKPTVLMIGPYPQRDIEPLERDYDVRKIWLAENKAVFLDRATQFVRAIATRGELGADTALIDRCPELEIIACYGVGVDAIDLTAARSRGVRVTNTPDVLTEDVADFAFALVLVHLRKVLVGDAHVRSGAWMKGPLPLGASLRGKTLGVLGLGRIGRTIARRAEGFGLRLAYCATAPSSGVPYAYHGNAVSLAKAPSPHQSSGSVETRKAMGKLVRDNLEAHFAGRPLLTPVVSKGRSECERSLPTPPKT